MYKNHLLFPYVNENELILCMSKSRAGIKSFHENEKNKFSLIRRLCFLLLREMCTLPTPIKLITHSRARYSSRRFTRNRSLRHTNKKSSRVTLFAILHFSQLSRSAFYEFERCLYTPRENLSDYEINKGI